MCEALIDVLRPSIEGLLKIYGVSARITFGCWFRLGFGASCCTIGLQAELVWKPVFLLMQYMHIDVQRTSDKVNHASDCLRHLVASANVVNTAH